MNLTIAVLLYLAGLALVFLEMYVPGGILAVLGAACLCGSIGITYSELGSFWGTLQLLVTLVISFGMFRLVVRRVSLRANLAGPDGVTREGSELQDLVGESGTAETPLRPSGIARVGGKRLQALTRGEMLARGSALRVIGVSGNSVVVRGCGEDEGEDARRGGDEAR